MDRVPGTLSADRLTAENGDLVRHAVHAVQDVASSTGSALHGVSLSTVAPAALIQGSGDLLSLLNAAGTQKLKVDNSGNLTVGGAISGAISGQYLCAPSAYAPSSQVEPVAATTTLAAFNLAATTVAAGSNGGEISQVASWSSPSAGVLDVATTAGWPTSGTVTVAASGSTTAIVTYTGTAGGNQLTGCAYVSGSATGTVATSGAVTLTSLTLQTNSFSAPPSGNVLVTVHAVMQQSTGGDLAMLALAAAGTVTPVIGNTTTLQLNGATTLNPVTALFYVTGLTPGTSYQFALLGAAQSGTTVTIFAQGLTSTTIGNRGGPVVMTVQAV